MHCQVTQTSFTGVRMVKQQTKMSIAKVQANITKREEGEVNLLSRSLEIH
jgi:hypothetical protein